MTPAMLGSKKRFFAAATAVCLLPILLISLLTYDPADPPGTAVYPPNQIVENGCGRVGAFVAHEFIQWLGSASLLALPVVGNFIYLLFRRRSMTQIAVSTVAAASMLLSFAALVQPLRWDLPFTSPLGNGGLAGAVFNQVLMNLFSPIGTLLVLLPLATVSACMTFEGFWNRTLKVSGWVLSQAGKPVRWFLDRREEKIYRLAEEPEDEPGFETPSYSDFDYGAAASDEKFSEPENINADEEEDEPDSKPQWEHPSRGLKIVRTEFQSDAPYETPPASTEPLSTFSIPELDLLDDPEPFDYTQHDDQVRERARLLEKTFAQFQMKVKVVQIDTGPVVTQYEIELEPGLRSRRVIALADDLSIAMRAPSVRIVAPIPGKNTVGIEVPNESRAKVSLKEVIRNSADRTENMRLPLYLGKDVKGLPMVCDLAKMPHLLISGRTGTGKSVCLNALILSVLMTRTPDQVRMLMIDPKMVELSLYREIPHLLHPVVTDMKKAEALLAWAVEKMEERYELLARVGVRHLDSYNNLSPDELRSRLGDDYNSSVPDHLPYILIFADEMADLMMTAAKEVEAHIIRLAQKSRAVGIHLILATQKPTVDVITGLIKSNLPARIAFQVASRSDSRVVLDEMGADKLLGNGDMLFLYPGTSKILRAQGTFVSDEEVQRMTEYLSAQGRPQYSQELIELESKNSSEDGETGEGPGTGFLQRDDLYEAAVDVVVREQRGSVSLLQRALGIGYGRAARLIDYMAEDGLVGEYNGSQAREVLLSTEEWEQTKDELDRAG